MCAFATLLLTLQAGGPAAAGEEFAARPGELELTGRLIVRAKEGEFEAARVLLGDALLADAPAVRHLRVSVPSGAGDEVFAAALMATGIFEYAHPDWLCFPAGAPNDPLFGSQWHHARMRSAEAWDWITDYTPVIFANTDTGVDVAHPDFAGLLVPGYNAVDGLPESLGGHVGDVNGHGTMTAGCACAGGDNGVGTAGMGWTLRLMPVRVSNSANGSASLWDIDEGARWAAEHGARVVSTSFTGVRAASNGTTGAYLRTIGALWVWAIDNSNNPYPDNQPYLTVVVGTDGADAKWSSSSWGHLGDCAAPCTDVWTTTNGGGWGAGTGTSFAAPLAAGALAAIFAANPFLTPEECEERLFRGCDDLGAPGDDNVFGRGRVNLERAVLEAAGGTLALTTGGLAAGQAATFDFAGAQPGARVWLAFSLTGLALTPVSPLQATLALASPAALRDAVADAAGAGVFAIGVPASAQGRAVWFQAAERGNASPFLAVIVQ